jgi:microcystin-dependent protein
MATVPMLQTAADQSASQIAGAASSFVPTGVVFHFAGSSAPSGWLLCNGAAVSRGTYAALYAALGGAASPYGQGDGTTTFNVPNTSGVFISGTGSQTIGAATYTRTHGATQGDVVQGHWHALPLVTNTNLATSGGTLQTIHSSAGTRDYTNTAIGSTASAAIPDGTNGTPRTGTETRPANIAMNHIIKI